MSTSGITSVDATARIDAFAPGDVIAGKYVVERVIGLGGVGVVLAAKHIELDEMVAIKFLHKDMQQRGDVVRRFANEAKAAVRIKSEYAARVYDVGVLPDHGPYLVMEYLEGQNLADVLEDGTPLPLKRVVEFTLQVCEALAVAHSVGIVHRDIKPENLFLARRPDGTEVMKVLDFGISKAALTGNKPVVSPSETQDLMGTPLYMSPEQIRSTADVDHRSDVWSLGVVLYEMVTRRVPFPGDTVPKICSRVLETQPQPLATFANVPPGFQQVMDRCLEKDVGKRFQNVAELAIALLPFGPTRGAVFAERTSGILQASGHMTSLTFRFSSAPPASDPSPVSIPGAPTVPSFSNRPTDAHTFTGPPSGMSGMISTHPEAVAAFTNETRRMRKTTIIAMSILVVGVLGAAGAFVFGRSPAPQPTASAATTAEAPPAQPVATPPPTAAPSGEVAVTLGARPADARLYLDDALLPSNPFKSHVVRDGKPHSVRAEATGYVTRSVAVTFDSDKEIVLALDKSNAPPARGPVTWSPPSRNDAHPPSRAEASPASPPAAAPAPAAPAPAPAKGMSEVDLSKSKKPVRALDTAQPW